MGDPFLHDLQAHRGMRPAGKFLRIKTPAVIPDLDFKGLGSGGEDDRGLLSGGVFPDIG
jgi:hypothetical protein